MTWTKSGEHALTPVEMLADILYQIIKVTAADALAKGDIHTPVKHQAVLLKQTYKEYPVEFDDLQDFKSLRFTIKIQQLAAS